MFITIGQSFRLTLVLEDQEPDDTFKLFGHISRISSLSPPPQQSRPDFHSPWPLKLSRSFSPAHQQWFGHVRRGAAHSVQGAKLMNVLWMSWAGSNTLWPIKLGHLPVIKWTWRVSWLTGEVYNDFNIASKGSWNEVACFAVDSTIFGISACCHTRHDRYSATDPSKLRSSDEDGPACGCQRTRNFFYFAHFRTRRIENVRWDSQVIQRLKRSLNSTSERSECHVVIYDKSAQKCFVVTKNTFSHFTTCRMRIQLSGWKIRRRFSDEGLKTLCFQPENWVPTVSAVLWTNGPETVNTIITEAERLDSCIWDNRVSLGSLACRGSKTYRRRRPKTIKATPLQI